MNVVENILSLNLDRFSLDLSLKLQWWCFGFKDVTHLVVGQTQLLRERDERIRHLVQEAEAAKKGAQDVAQSKEELGGFLHMVVADRDAALVKSFSLL